MKRLSSTKDLESKGIPPPDQIKHDSREMDDAELVQMIADAEEDIRTGKTIPHDEVKRRLKFISPKR